MFLLVNPWKLYVRDWFFQKNAVILDYSIFSFFSTLFVGFLTTARYKQVCFMNSSPLSKVAFLALFTIRVTGVLSWGYQKVVHSLQNGNGKGIRGICFIVTTCLKEKKKGGFQGVGFCHHLTSTLWKYHWASLDLATAYGSTNLTNFWLSHWQQLWLSCLVSKVLDV